MKVSKALLDRARQAPVQTQEDIEREDAETRRLAAELGVELPEVVGPSDSPEERARKIGRNASIAAWRQLRDMADRGDADATAAVAAREEREGGEPQ